MDHDSEYSERPGKRSRSFMTPSVRQQLRSGQLAVPKRDASTTTVFSRMNIRKTYAGISVAALKAKCTPHTDALSLPKWPRPRMHFTTFAEREMQREKEEEMTKEELRWLRRKPMPVFNTGVSRAALTASCSPRLSVISQAKILFLTYNKRNFFDKLSDLQKNAMNRYIREVLEEFQVNHPPEIDKSYQMVNGALIHATCSGREEVQLRTEKYICELNKQQRKSFRRRMKKLAEAKKRSSQAPAPDRGPKKKLKEFTRLRRIARPRRVPADEVPYNPFKVSTNAQKYTASDRVKNLAKHRVPPPPPPFFDYEGNELPPRREWSFNSRRRIIPSPRTLELSTPRFTKKKAADDVKEDPFAVVRRALTAFCTPRTKELAEPRNRE